MDVGGIQWGWRFSLILDGPYGSNVSASTEAIENYLRR